MKTKTRQLLIIWLISMRVLVDTNVLVDVLEQREPYYVDSAKVWQAHVDAEIQGYVSATTVTDIFYILRRQATRADARRGVQRVLNTFSIATINYSILQVADQLNGFDFEDDVQIACAMAYSLDAIVTRDQKGFRSTAISVLTPTEILKQL